MQEILHITFPCYYTKSWLGGFSIFHIIRTVQSQQQQMKILMWYGLVVLRVTQAPQNSISPDLCNSL